MSTPTTHLEAAHDELTRRYHAADKAGDWREREVLNPLVDVADYLRRIGDHRESGHYRADKAGPLLSAACRLQHETLLAYAGWPDDDTPQARALEAAADVLNVLRRVIRAAMMGAARDPDGVGIDSDDAKDLRQAVRQFTEWAEQRISVAQPTDDERAASRWS